MARWKEWEAYCNPYQMGIGGKLDVSLMECLPPTVQVIMSMWIIISQHSTNHLGDQNIQAIGALNKKKLSKGDMMAEKGRGQITHPQIQVQLMSLVGWNDNMTVYAASIIVSNRNLQHLCAGGIKRKNVHSSAATKPITLL